MNDVSGAPMSARVRVACLCLVATAIAVGMSYLRPGLSAAADHCPNAEVRQQQKAASLPDCRAYEIVNPATDDYGETNRVSNMADDGNAVAYMSVVAGDTALGAGIASVSVARRTSDGWSTTSADPQSLGPIAGATGVTGPKVFTPDFSKELVSTNLPVIPSDGNYGADHYVIDVGRGTGTLMTQGVNGLALVFGASTDLSRVVFRNSGTLPSSGIFVSDGHSLELLSVYPDNVTPMPSGAADPAGSAWQRGLGVAEGRDASPWVERGGDHSVSDDARRVYMSDHSQSRRDLYLRDMTGPTAETIAVSASQRTSDLGSQYGGAFISASHDGAVAYFVSGVQLTDAGTPGGGIYRFDARTRQLTQITPDAGAPSGINVTAAISSDDQSHIYFTSTDALVAEASAGFPNAYVWTNAHGVRYLGQVGAGDRFERVTPDGRYALLLSASSISGANNSGFRALYRYSDAGQVVCVSCRPNGAASAGEAGIEIQSAGFPGGTITHNRALTSDGRVVFTSGDRILPTDQTSAVDVYYYADGKVSMLSPGQGDTNSFVGDVSDDGRNIFIITRSPLVGADRDAAEFDIYDVRVDGGFLEPPAPREVCQLEDCQSHRPADGGAPAPSSSSTGGAGNVTESVRKHFSAPSLTPRQRATLARTGTVMLKVRVSGGGEVKVRGRAPIAGRAALVGSASAVALKERTTTLSLRFRLSSRARHELSRRHRLRLTLETRLVGVSKPVLNTANLSRGHS